MKSDLFRSMATACAAGLTSILFLVAATSFTVAPFPMALA